MDALLDNAKKAKSDALRQDEEFARDLHLIETTAESSSASTGAGLNMGLGAAGDRSDVRTAQSPTQPPCPHNPHWY